MADRASRPAPLEATSPRVTKLSNGLRVVTLELPAAHRVALVGNLLVGSRYETEVENGISHLLEHMLYRGIPGHPTAHDQALAFEALGGTLVAATGSDSGSMAVSFPAESFERTVDLFASVFREPLLSGLDVEKRIVREEILEDLDEDGHLIDDYDLLRAAAFDGHPLGYPVIGTVAHVDRLTVEDLRRHHGKHYVGGGTVIAVAGPIDADSVVRHVERRLGDVPRGEAPPLLPPAPRTASRLGFVQSSSSQTAIRIGFRGPGIHDPLEPATELLLRLLDDGNSTRLYSRLCDEQGLAYDVSAGYEAADDAGLLDIACDVAHAEAVTVLGEILDVVKRLRDEGPLDAELAKAKARHRWSLEEMLDSSSGAADFLADAVLRGYASSLAERRDQIDSVTKDRVRDAAAAMLRRENLTAVVVGVQTKKRRHALSELVDAFR